MKVAGISAEEVLPLEDCTVSQEHENSSKVVS